MATLSRSSATADGRLAARHGWSRWLQTTGGRLVVVAGVLALLTGGALAAGLDRGALWVVVRYCTAQKQAIGLAFPCLEVDLDDGVKGGVAILRAPLERSHVIVVPTTRLVGIEAPQLLDGSVPNYWQRAWEARHYVSDEVPRPLARADFGLAVNSARGRSQDQLHIHIDCVDPAVRRALDAHQDEIGPRWTRLNFRLSYHPYWAMRIERADLQGVNPVKLVAETLPGASEDMRRETVGVLGATFRNGKEGFFLLAGQSTKRNGDAVAEDLLDHACPAP